jgi:hypothetical protein
LQLPASQRTPAAQALSPLQITAHVAPPQPIEPLHAFTPLQQAVVCAA